MCAQKQFNRDKEGWSLFVEKHTTTAKSKITRRNYSRISGSLELPNLVEIQTNSYKWFKEVGIKEVFDDIYPHFYFSLVADYFFTIFQLSGATDIQPYGSVEFQSITTGSCFRVTKHDTDFFTQLVD